MKFKLTLTTLASSLLFTGMLNTTVFAENKIEQTNTTKLIKKLTNDQVEIINTFPSLGNLIGVVIKPKDSDNAQESILYVDKTGKYIISGALITPDGQNQTQIDGKKYIGSKIATKAYHDIKNTAWIEDGNKDAKHVIYAVADPNCIYCHKLFEQTRTAVKNGDLTIRWIWVGFLKPNSKDLALAIMSAKDPMKAIDTNEIKFNEATEQGGLKPVEKPSKKVMADFDKNMAFMNKYQFPGTPVIIYQDNKGQAEASFGLPSKEELTKIIQSASAK
ncbi:MAG: thiol:disulfide interchange protein DsbG [Legionellales bacterium]|nr:thiol:disulfide interchange protein DsbG [Legionellales bacterium]|tara:strand:- start:1688 stop:2512 length:825 start_codon:yes stop_codon:yes gene_type:complete